MALTVYSSTNCEIFTVRIKSCTRLVGHLYSALTKLQASGKVSSYASMGHILIISLFHGNHLLIYSIIFLYWIQ